MAAANPEEPATGRPAPRWPLLVSARYRWAIAVSAAVAVALSIIAMRAGIGVSADSVGYASAARSFAAGNHFTYFDGQPLVLWPIGLPFILGVGLKLGVGVTTTAIVLNILACGALIALAAAMGLRATGSKPVSAAIAAGVAVAQTTVHLYSELWSEPLFVVACVAAVLVLMDIAARGPSLGRVAAAVACVWAASNLRFMGVTLVPVVGVAMLVASPRRPSLRALAVAAAATVVAGLGTLFVLGRNYLVGGSTTGVWNPSHATIGGLIRTTIDTVGHWLLPIPLPGLLAGIALSVLAAYGAVALLRDAATRRLAAPMAAFVVVYVGALVVIESRVDGFIDERYLSPVLVPSLVLIVVALRELWRMAAVGRGGSLTAGRSTRQWAALVASAAIVAGAVGYLGVNAAASARFAVLTGPTRRGYNSEAARASQLARAAAAVVGDPGVVANDPELVYWTTGRFPTYAPRSFTRHGADAAAALRAWVASGAVTAFAEFTDPQTSGGWTAADLRRWGITLSDPVRYPDGTLYHLSIRGGADDPTRPAAG